MKGEDSETQRLNKKLEKAGFRLTRHGGNHDIYIRENDCEKVPRHRELNEKTARTILKRWKLR